MTYQPTLLKDVPQGTDFLQDIATTSLKEADLSSRYGFVFEKSADDISASEVCIVKSNPGQYFLIVCRSELPEWQVVIHTARSIEPIESYAHRMVAHFIEATRFDVQDIEQIWPAKC